MSDKLIVCECCYIPRDPKLVTELTVNAPDSWLEYTFGICLECLQNAAEDIQNNLP